MATLECGNHPKERPLTGTVTLKQSVEITYLKILALMTQCQRGREERVQSVFQSINLSNISYSNPGQKSLGQYCNIHIFLLFLGSSPVQRFRNFLAVLPPPTLYKVETWKKILDTRIQHCCGVRGGAGPM